jgi:neutral ceramidase
MKSSVFPRVIAWVLLLSLTGCLGPQSRTGLIPVGVARVDISPTNAVRLMGYAARAQLAAPTSIIQRIHARALLIGSGQNAALLLTIDNCILPKAVTEEVRARLVRRLALAPEAITLSVTHTHSAPCLKGAAPNIFAADLTSDDVAQIAMYTDFLIGRLEEVAVAAMQDRRPAKLDWGQGTVGFAKNRRTAQGPVDHSLPVLRVTGVNGQIRAVFTSYACHCTTLSGDLNGVHGDWAGVAAQALERDHPGCVALVAIGTGADANPEPRGSIEWVNLHGEVLAREANRLLALPLKSVTSKPACRLKIIQLPFQPHFTRAQWQVRAKQLGIVGYHARKWLARLEQGTPLPNSLPYPIQTWSFGDQLALVFLGGEVVVDYGLRLKHDLDSERLWINAYANDVPCYIPSKRILSEGGYEAESSLWYYDQPQQLQPASEELIHATVRELLPPTFHVASKKAASPLH